MVTAPTPTTHCRRVRHHLHHQQRRHRHHHRGWELRTAIAEGVVTAEIRRRSWRVQVLQNRVDGMIALSAARAAEYAEENPAAATGLLIKDYRGKDANQVVWKFDSALESKIMEALKQAAIEDGQWSEKRDLARGIGIALIMERLNAGRQRAADFRKARDAKAALESATKIVPIT